MKTLDHLIPYLGDTASYKIIEKGDSTGIQVKLKGVTFMYEGFPNEKTAKEMVFREILLTGVDMIMDEELFKQYQEKKREKYENTK